MGPQRVSFWNYRAGPETFLSSETSLPLGKMEVLVVAWDGTHSRGGLQLICCKWAEKKDKGSSHRPALVVRVPGAAGETLPCS